MPRRLRTQPASSGRSAEWIAWRHRYPAPAVSRPTRCCRTVRRSRRTTASPSVDLFANLLQDPRVGLVTDDDGWFDVVVVQSIHGVGHRPHRAVVDVHSVQLDAAADLAAHEIGPVAVAPCVPSVLPKLWARLDQHGASTVSEQAAGVAVASCRSCATSPRPRTRSPRPPAGRATARRSSRRRSRCRPRSCRRPRRRSAVPISSRPAARYRAPSPRSNS